MATKILSMAGKLLAAFTCGVVCAAAYVAIDRTMGDDLGELQGKYCAMVQIYKETNGERGWPDYNGDAAEVCNGHLD